MGALLKFNGFASFYFLTFSKQRLQCWKSLMASGLTAQRATAFSNAHFSVAGETDLVLRQLDLSGVGGLTSD